MSDTPERPPIASAPLSVVLLARNVEADLAEVVGGWITLLDSLEREYEVILVEDGSSDGTAAKADALAGQNPRLQVLHHQTGQGFGAALRAGIGTARYPLLFCSAGDRQYEPEDLKKLLAEIDKVDLVTGYRVSRPLPLWLRWPGYLYRGLIRILFGVSLEKLPGWLGWRAHRRRWIARLLFGVRVGDVGCTFQLFRRSIFARIPIQSKGTFSQVEILAKANFLGCYMTEVPITHHPPADSRQAIDTPDRRERKEAFQLLAHADFGPVVLPPVAKGLETSISPEVQQALDSWENEGGAPGPETTVSPDVQ
jgi:glycosyltransferase involved in cell wall biosynthesis